MQQYLSIISKIKEQRDNYKDDRTGTGCYSLFGQQMRFDLSKGFPLLTTKKMYIRGIIHELLWFLSGSTNNNDLRKHGVTIWDEWALPNGELGPIYSEQWINYPIPIGTSINYNTSPYPTASIDYQYLNQIQTVIDQINDVPHSRRMIVVAWNPAVLPDETISPHENIKQGKQALPACHTLFQFHVLNNTLSCNMYQRSGDMMLGVPYNIASYALLTMMIAQVTNLQLGELIITIGDAHVYSNHIAGLTEQLKREPYGLPQMKLNSDIDNVFDFTYSDFELIGYNSHPKIEFPIAV